MPEWDYELEGGESQPFAGFPVDLYFEETKYGPKAQIKVRRAHPELYPNSPAEQRWNYNVAVYGDKGWTVEDGGARIVHAEGRKLNSSTPFGKLFKSLRDHAPQPIPGDPTTAEFWKGLEAHGNFMWNWVEKPKHKQDPDDPTGKKWIVDTEKDPERNLVIVGHSGEGATNGQVFDLTGIPAELVTQIRDAVANVPAGDKNALFAALGTVPGAFNVQTVTGALAGDASAEALRTALTDF